MIRISSLLLALPMSLLLAAPAHPGEMQVKITVSEPAGVARKAEPATGGIPFKKGQVKDVKNLALFSASGTPIPAQFSRLAGYEDGSVQWALVDFVTDLPAGGKSEFVVKGGRATAPARPLTIKEAGGLISVDTGAARFTINSGRANYELLESVELGGGKIAGPGAIKMVEAGGKVFAAGKPTKVGWEYRGPMRATLRLDGANRSDDGKELIYYTVRLTFWAGNPLLRVRHKLRNSDAREGFDARIKQATVELNLGFKGNEQGKGDYWSASGDGKKGLLLVHRHAGGCFPGSSAYRRSGSRTLRRQSLEAGRATVFAIPPGDTPATGRGNRLYGYEATGKFFALADCAHKDTEIWFDFYAGTRTAAANGARAKALRSWLHALADPAWISETETMGYGKFGTLADEIATYKKWGWKGWDKKNKYPKMPHQPEAYVPKEVVHYESEADSAECYLLMYLRTGERGYLDWGQAWAEFGKTHYAYRTDGFAYKGHPRGPRSPSKGLKVGWYAPKGNTYGWSDSRSEYCHFYARGIFDSYCLTGDVDALEGGRDLVEEVAAWALPRYKPGSPIGTYGCRGFARGWLGVLRLAQLTRSAPDLKLANRLGAVVLKARDWDERGFIYWGTGASYIANKQLSPAKMPPKVKAYIKEKGISVSPKGIVTDKSGKKWPIRSDGGSWQQTTLQAATERYWRLTGNKEAKRRTGKMAEFAKKYQMSKKCEQVFYYTILDFPEYDRVYDPADWDDAHKNCPGPGAEHSGHYTRFLVGVFSRAYSATGDKSWLDWAKKAWNRGSKRGYESVKASAADNEVYKFAWHVAPKDDTALSTARVFFQVPRAK